MTDPRCCEVRISWVGGGPIVVRGRLAWLVQQLATKGGAPLMEDVDRLADGHLEADWSAAGHVRLTTKRTYNWPGEVR